MSTASTIRDMMTLETFVVKGYLDDLSDDDLMVRPVPGINHIAWQLGHLIVAENGLVSAVCPGSMPALPEGFAEQHSKETAASDDRSKFCSKAEYLRLREEQRAGTLAALEKMSDAELEQLAPEKLQMFGRTAGAVIGGQVTHWMMHAGQWAVTRRKLGHPAMF